MADGYYRIDLPRVDLHSHAGRCFLAGLPAGHSLVAALGAASVADAVLFLASDGAGYIIAWSMTPPTWLPEEELIIMPSLP